MSDERDDDPDREAILARRRKLVAVALAGLTSAAGCDDSTAEPVPCLQPVVVGDREGETTLTPIDPPKEPPTETAMREGTTTGEEEPGTGQETDKDIDEEGEARPRPCLTTRPRVCLRRPAPQMRPSQPMIEPDVCLFVTRKPEDGEPPSGEPGGGDPGGRAG